jgi:hypothetical protein
MDRLTKVYNMVGYRTYVFKLCAFDITKKPFQPTFEIENLETRNLNELNYSHYIKQSTIPTTLF